MSNEEKAHEAIEHLQAAALELIAAARAALDVAEDLVHDPGPLVGLVAGVADLVAPLAARARSQAPSGPYAPDADEAPGRAPRVQHIRVS